MALIRGGGVCLSNGRTRVERRGRAKSMGGQGVEVVRGGETEGVEERGEGVEVSK